MTTAVKTQPGLLVCWSIALLVIIAVGGYGIQAIVWLLMKLYEFFIEGNTTGV